MKLNKLLKNLRVNAGLSQLAVSDALGYGSPQFISNWERGISVPPADTVKTLAKLYKTDELFLSTNITDAMISEFKESVRAKYGV